MGVVESGFEDQLQKHPGAQQPLAHQPTCPHRTWDREVQTECFGSVWECAGEKLICSWRVSWATLKR